MQYCGTVGETRRQTEKTNFILRLGKSPVYLNLFPGFYLLSTVRLIVFVFVTAVSERADGREDVDEPKSCVEVETFGVRYLECGATGE